MHVPRTPKQYRHFLEVVLWTLKCTVEEGRLWPMGATRFGYLYSEITHTAWMDAAPEMYERIDAFEDPEHSRMRVAIADDKAPIDTRPVHPSSWRGQLEMGAKADYESGSFEAIIEFARLNREALKSTWVVEELTRWRLDGSNSAKKNFDRVIRAYWDVRGHRAPSEILREIERDQKIYWDFEDMDRLDEAGHKITRGERLQRIAEQHGVSRSQVGDVFKALRPVLSRCVYEKSSSAPSFSLKSGVEKVADLNTTTSDVEIAKVTYE